MFRKIKTAAAMTAALSMLLTTPAFADFSNGGPGMYLDGPVESSAPENPYTYVPPTPDGGPGAVPDGNGTTAPDANGAEPGGAPDGTGTTAPDGSNDGVSMVAPDGTGGGGFNLNNSDLSLTQEAGKVQADPVLGLVPELHAQMLKADGNLTEGFTTNMAAFSSPEEGFTGLKIMMGNGVGDVFYRVYTAQHGWSKWAMNEMITPYTGDGAKVQAVQIRTKGYTRNLYDVYYQATLNDGTVLDWAHDGQTAGTLGTDQYIQSLQLTLWKHDLPFWQPTANHMRAQNYEGIVQGGDGRVRYSTFNGNPYTGWAYDTQNNKYYFVDSNPVTGWQYIDGYKYYFDESGKVVTDLEPIIGITGDYKLRLNKEMKTLTVYGKDGDNGYIMPVKVILTTIGPDTPIGTFKTYEKYRWKFMHHNIYCQYLARFKNGYILHSLIYEDKPDSYHFNAGSYNYHGKIQSDGCVRMTAGDAAWVYNNCKLGTELTIYNDEWVMGPFDRPAIEWAIPMDQKYDPTDPVVIQQQQAAQQAG